MTEDVAKGYAKASAATKWRIIVEINLAQNSARWALRFGAAFARAISSTPGSKLLGFEIGNEPDLYATEILFGRKHIRGPGYSWDDLVKEWRPYIEAFKSIPITAAVPFIGPATDSGNWPPSGLGGFIDGVRASHLAFVTTHYYPLNVCGDQTVTIPELLSSVREASYISQARNEVRIVGKRHLKLVLGETNSVACEGEAGVSDVFASAVWGLDWLFANFEAGVQGVYFHLNNSFYSPVFVTTYRSPDDGELRYVNFVARLYYAMYAFAPLAECQDILPVRTHTTANIKAYALRRTSSSPVTVFVINKDVHPSGEVVVTPSMPMRKGRLLCLQAPSLASKRVSYGGANFDDNTGLSNGKPAATTVNPDSAGLYRIWLANSSIAVLTLDPKPLGQKGDHEMLIFGPSDVRPSPPGYTACGGINVLPRYSTKLRRHRRVLLAIIIATFFSGAACAQNQLPVQWEDLTAPEFIRAMQRSQGACILPFGILEKHGPHLPIGTDLFNIRYIAIHAAEHDYAVVFPAYYFGEIFEAKHQPGAVAYSAGLEMQLLQQTTDEMARNGCKKIIIANGHGGNSYLLPYFAQTQLASPRDYVVYIWDIDNVRMNRPGRPPLKHRHDGHAGEAETSWVLVSRPDLVHLSEAGTETWRALHRLHLPSDLFTGISWYADFPNHYAGDGSAGNKALGEFDMTTFIRSLQNAIRAAKADDESLKLQNEFYDAARHPLRTKQ